MYALHNEQDHITNNRDKMFKLAEKLYREMYCTTDRQTEDPIFLTCSQRF